MLGVQNVNVARSLDVSGPDHTRTFLAQHQALGALALHGNGDFLDVEHDVGHVLAHSGDRRELVQHAIDLHRCNCGTLQRRQQHPAQRIAKRRAEAPLQRFGRHRRNPAPVAARLHFKLRRTDQFLPVFLIDLHLLFSRQCQHVQGGAPDFKSLFEHKPRSQARGLTHSFKRGGASAGGTHCAESVSHRGST